MIHKNVVELVNAVHKRGLPVHVETSGALEGRYDLFDWVTVSPKWARLPVADAWRHADEVKVIVEDEHSVRTWEPVLVRGLKGRQRLPQVWLHPEWSKREDFFVLQTITQAVKRNPRYRAGWQLHKHYRADILDERAQQDKVPLGGDFTKGF